jgi:hypothetical protein
VQEHRRRQDCRGPPHCRPATTAPESCAGRLEASCSSALPPFDGAERCVGEPVPYRDAPGSRRDSANHVDGRCGDESESGCRSDGSKHYTFRDRNRPLRPYRVRAGTEQQQASHDYPGANLQKPRTFLGPLG